MRVLKEDQELVLQPLCKGPDPRTQQEKGSVVENPQSVIDKWMADRVLRPFKLNREPTSEDKKKPFYCRYHRYEVQQNPLLQYHKGKATIAVLFHIGGDEDEILSSTKAYYFEANFYDELGLNGDESISRPVGIPLPSW
ncbi:hypothetical protein SO802_017509 [Lithocarpus litseifolius]|uniref:Uncharacterized protein n=1 Tax=Lithocarpus litseifolius TaxID=425828 RepID=A0AAW2CI60_9ROSI